MKNLILLLLISACFSCSVKKKNTGFRIHYHGRMYLKECGHCNKYFNEPSEHKEFKIAPKKDWIFDPFEEDTSNRKMFNVLKKSDTLIKK